MKKKIISKKKNKIIDKKKPYKKSLSVLMKDEDGFVSKETILKVGLSTIAALGVVNAVTDISSGGTTHTNSVTQSGSNCIVHTNVTAHSSY